MNRARSLDDIARLRRAIERVGRLSDGLIRIGPLRLGLDGILAWIPFIPAGALYSVLAGVYLLVQGYRAHAPWSVMAKSAAMLSLRSLATGLGESVVPLLIVELGVDVFRAHKWTADLLLQAIDQTQYVDGPRDRTNPNLTRSESALRASGKRRLVFFG